MLCSILILYEIFIKKLNKTERQKAYAYAISNGISNWLEAKYHT